MEEKDNNQKTVIADFGQNVEDSNIQRTDENIDEILKSAAEEEELRKRKQRTHQASTTPDKNHVG